MPLQQCLEHYLLSTTNQRFCVIVNYTIQLISAVIHQKGPSPLKKKLSVFLGILGSFWRILDISKRILDLFSGKFRKRPHFGNYVAKPILVSFFPFLCLSATYAPGLRSPPKRKRTSCSLNHIKLWEKRLHWSFPKCSLSVMIGWAGINRRNQKYYITLTIFLFVPLPQEVWKATKKVGVAIATKKDGIFTNTYIVARYYPPGNTLGNFGSNVE